MTASDLLKYQLDDCTYQLEKCFEGIPEPLMDEKLDASGMSPRETLVHLAECCTAYLTMMEGGEHNWGTYVAPSTTTDGLKETLFALRAKVVQSAQSDDIRSQKGASAFLVIHDPYHIGQICALRIAKDAGFDPYSIYKHEA